MLVWNCEAPSPTRHTEISYKSSDFLLSLINYIHSFQGYSLSLTGQRRLRICGSVPDPDPYVFRPPGSASGFVSHKDESGFGSCPVIIKV